jgi:PKD domain
MDCSSLFTSGRGRRSLIALVTLVLMCVAAFVLSGNSHAADPLPGVQADFKWSPAVPAVGQTVTFESTSHATGVGNAVVDYRWDLDGDTGNGYETGWGSTPVITTSYAELGTYDVRLQVKDSFDNRSTIKKTVTVAAQAPVASYAFAPAAPLVNQPVTFTSTSTDAGGTIAEQVWDLNGDGVYDNGAGPTALRSFSAPGSYVVGLRVTDNNGAVGFYSQTIVVGALPGPTGLGKSRLLSPFPVVRIAGRTTRGGVRLTRLSVDAPPGSVVRVRCKGPGCPFRSSVRAAKVVRLRRLERTLRAGVIIRIYVTGTSAIGKYTVFKIRRGHPPVRDDSCLMPGSLKPIACPTA